MNLRWYIPALLIALAFFGISIEQSATPNQEIVVQFNANSVSETEAKQAISGITAQLKAIGVEDFQISEIRNGKLKVTYYSATDVAIIKGLFDKQEELQLGDTAFNNKKDSSEFPSDNDLYTYKLDVVKIKKDLDSDMGLHGLPVELKSAKDQYLNLIVSLGASEANFYLTQDFESVAYKNYRHLSLLIDNTSHKIPEVRAGPLS